LALAGGWPDKRIDELLPGVWVQEQAPEEEAVPATA
jgi:hypothetical protein